MPSCIASSFSHGEAFISAKPERTITLTSSPPSRFAVRQQSMAVLPPPSTMTRRPTDVDVTERHRGEPVDADVDLLRRFLAAWNVQVAPARRARPDEDRVELLSEQRLHRFDPRAAVELDAEPEHVTRLLVDHFLRQPEPGNLRSDHSASLRVLVEDGDVVAERRQVARDRQRGRTGADTGHAPAVHGAEPFGQPTRDVVLEVGGDALQSADGDRLGTLGLILFDPSAPARWFTWPVAGAPKDPGEDIRLPVDHVGVGETAGRDQADVLRDRGVGGAGPLAIHDAMEVLRIPDIRRLHACLLVATVMAAAAFLLVEAVYAGVSGGAPSEHGPRHRCDKRMARREAGGSIRVSPRGLRSLTAE